MLVPFSVNQTVVDQFKIPQHFVDWTRIKILKAIDDKRFKATRYANIDLSLDALLYLKLLELLKIANPKFDATGRAVDVDPISYAFDVTKDQLLNEINSLAVAANNYYDNTQATNIQNFFNQIVSGNMFLAKLACGPSQGLINGYDSPYYAVVVPPATINRDFLKDGVVADILITQTYLAGGIDAAKGRFFQKIPYNYDMYISNKSYTITTFATVNIYSANFSRGNPIVQSVIYFYDSSIPTTSMLINALLVDAEIAANLAVNTSVVATQDYLALSGFSSITALAPTPVYVPNYYFDPASAATVTYSMRSPTSSYSLVVANNLSNFPYWYNKARVTLQNGKTYDVLNGPFAPTNQFVTSVTFKTTLSEPLRGSRLPIPNVTYVVNLPYTVETKLISGVSAFTFLKLNQSQSNFPVVFPIRLTDATYKIRNGYLFSDAANLYDLTFQQFPQSIMDKLVTLASLQDSMINLIDDINKGELFNQSTPDYQWKTFYFDDFGVKKEFVHPVSLKPVLAQNYLFELVVESAVAWDAAEKEIVAFLDNLQVKNDAAYNTAYQNFLRGQATIQGADALAVYEQKLKTGLFYSQNGFDYWRPFTPEEVKLIEKFKADALINKDIADQNALILAQNKIYQDQVNAAVTKANQEKIQLATYMAQAQIKAEVDQRLSQIVAPTMDYLIARAEKEGGFPSDALNKWVAENPEYYFREDLRITIGNLLNKVTELEQKVSTSLVADKIAEVEITMALKEMFNIEGL